MKVLPLLFILVLACVFVISSERKREIHDNNQLTTLEASPGELINDIAPDGVVREKRQYGKNSVNFFD